MKKILAILLSVVMLLGCVVISTAADENDAPTFHPVSATEPTVLNIIEKGAWSENNLEAEQHKVPLNVLEDSVHDFRFGDTATFNINVAKAGTYTLALTHIWAAPSNWTVTIDGAEAVPVVISQSPDWFTAGDAALGAYELTAGDHTITLTCAQEDSGQHIYSLTVTPPKFEVEVAVDNQGAAEAHGLTVSNSVTISVSYQFKTNAAFKAFSAKLGFFSPDKSINVTITDVASEEVIKTWTPNGFEGVAADDSTGAWATFELDSELPAGEYIIQMDPVAGVEGDVLWKKYDVVDANGILTSVCDNYDGEKDTARNATPCLTFTFTELAEDDVYFAKAGETPVEPPVEPETTAPETTAPETTAPETTVAPETTAPETTAPETTAPETTAPETTVADTTVADTTAAATTAAGTEAGTAAGTGATGTKAPATTTAAAASEGCKAVVGSMSAIALVAIASAAAVVLKKKED